MTEIPLQWIKKPNNTEEPIVIIIIICLMSMHQESLQTCILLGIIFFYFSIFRYRYRLIKTLL